MCSWPRLLLLLCSAVTPVLGCDWQRRYGALSNASFHHLLQMGGDLTPQQSPVAFPDSLYRHCYTAQMDFQLTFARDNFHFLFELWLRLLNHSNQAVIGWDVQQIQLFLSVIRRQETELNTCLTKKTPTNKRLKRHYRKLRRLLGRSGGSSASWELIRWLTELHLEQLDILLSHIKYKQELDPITSLLS